ncbi:MAG: hypothetical protein UHN47_04095 [Lachnospiraceae bacterium]|nr:hypothetical protein [Lachnospiraceae bacterium]
MSLKEGENVKNPFKYYAKKSAGIGRKDAISPITLLYEVEPELANEIIPVDADAEEYLNDIRRRKVLQQKNEQSITVHAPMIIKGMDVEKEVFSTTTNFHLCPKKIVKYIKRDGSCVAELEKVIFDIVMQQYGFTDTTEIRVCEIGKICSIVTRKYATAILGNGVNSAAIVEEKFRRDVAQVPIQYVLKEHGWQKIGNDIRYVYDDMPNIPNGYIVDTGHRLGWRKDCLRVEVGNILQKAFLLSENEKAIVPIVLFALEAPLFKLFQEAGFPIRYLLFLNGKTGSMKSTIGKILFLPFQERGRRETRRIDSDTMTSMERRIVGGGTDNITFIDDYAPQGTKVKANEMKNRLEYVIRMVGDGATKSRSNANLEDIQGEGVAGIVAVAGEIKGEGLSSSLRCMYTYMQREEVNLEIVSYFQGNEAAFPTIYAHFISFIEREWPQIIDYIRREYQHQRSGLSTIMKERRIIDAATSLLISAEIVKEFLLRHCQLEEGKVLESYERWKSAIIKNAQNNEESSLNEPPTTIFLKAINILRLNRQIAISKTKLSKENFYSFAGFEDDDYVYFLPEKVYTKVRQYAYSIGQPFIYSLRDLQIALYEEGLLITHSNGKDKKTYFARFDVGCEQKVNFWQIKKEKMYQILEDCINANANIVCDENW